MNKMYRIPTGDPGIDKVTGGGPTPPFFGLVVGRPHSGKSQKLVDICHEALKLEVPTLFISDELIHRRFDMKLIEHKKWSFMASTPRADYSASGTLHTGKVGFKERYGVLPKLVLIDIAYFKAADNMRAMVDQAHLTSKELQAAVWMTLQTARGTTDTYQPAGSLDVVSDVGYHAEMIVKANGYKTPASIIKSRDGWTP